MLCETAHSQTASISNGQSPLQACVGGKVDTEEGVHDDASSVASCASLTSTVKHGQESWEMFQHKVNLLAAKLFPGHVPADIKIERVAGGSDNRIVCITVPTDQPRKFKQQPLIGLLRGIFTPCGGKRRIKNRQPEKYILRIPRHGVEGMEYDIAVLHFAASHLTLPVPDIIKFDPSEDNPLEAGYMLQRQLPGQNLESAWDGLTFAQKKCIAREYIQLLKSLQQITNPYCAFIGPSDVANSSAGYQLEPLPIPGQDIWEAEKHSHGPTAPQTTLEFILNQSERGKEDFPWPFWEGFKKMAHGLHTQGFLPDTDSFHFMHLDLYPRNLLITLNSATSASITGVLDWDSALFVPAFVAYRAPFWLWAENPVAKDYEEFDEYQALREPANPEQRELKQMFEEMAGEKWLRYAYGREYISLRRIFPVLRDGSNDSYSLATSEEVIKTWMDWQEEKQDSPMCPKGSLINTGPVCEQGNEVDGISERRIGNLNSQVLLENTLITSKKELSGNTFISSKRELSGNTLIASRSEVRGIPTSKVERLSDRWFSRLKSKFTFGREKKEGAGSLLKNLEILPMKGMVSLSSVRGKLFTKSDTGSQGAISTSA